MATINWFLLNDNKMSGFRVYLSGIPCDPNHSILYKKQHPKAIPVWEKIISAANCLVWYISKEFNFNEKIKKWQALEDFHCCYFIPYSLFTIKWHAQEILVRTILKKGKLEPILDQENFPLFQYKDFNQFH